MSRTDRTSPIGDLDESAIVVGLSLAVYPEGDSCVVHATGELDRASRDQLYAACTAGDHRHMAIDLSAVTFMDCSGYGGLVASRLRNESDDRTFTISGVTGQPRDLVDMIERLEIGPDGAPVAAGNPLSTTLVPAPNARASMPERSARGAI